VHSKAEQRHRCAICDQTLAATKGTPIYRLRKAADLVTTVLTLLCRGCPTQAIVAAFGLDERAVPPSCYMPVSTVSRSISMWSSRGMWTCSAS
jgi:hypothetical protein